ncbi:MAG: glycosyltransferase family 2 protein [Alphaproteobacteria bacterium]|nr:glycosyltransferase family 2 protein [Alphaproteobacteria bacterium]
MTDDISNMRLLGMAAGLAVMLGTFVYFRGARWHRGNFLLGALLGLAFLIVSAAPDTVNGLRNLLDFEELAFGRIIAILVVSNVAALFLIFYVKVKLDIFKHKMDQFICAQAADRLLPDHAASLFKPVMIVIPALNEADSLESLLPRLPRQINGREVNVLVIDDGSSDGTSQVALRHGCIVARNPINRGQGAASRVGYRILAQQGVEIGVTMDGDNQHRPEDIGPMIEPILADKADLVIGSRILGSSDIDSRIRYVGVHFFSHLISLLTGQTITDCSSGFKAFRISRMRLLLLKEDQYQSSEVIIEAAKRGLRILEVPIHIAVREFGASRKGKHLTYALFFLKTILKSWIR